MANKHWPKIDPQVLSNMELKNSHYFKAEKRAQLKKVYRELEELNLGSIEMPPGCDVIKMLDKLKDWMRKCSVKEWGY